MTPTLRYLERSVKKRGADGPGCLDWAAGLPQAGGLGVALLRALLERHWLLRRQHWRAVPSSLTLLGHGGPPSYFTG